MPSATPHATATATPVASPPPGGPPSAELIGDWTLMTTNPNRAADLIFLGGTRYHLSSPGGDSFGMVVVNGTEIDFFSADPCDIPLPGGVGRYQWNLQNGLLRFVRLSDDPCGRVDELDNKSYRKKS